MSELWEIVDKYLFTHGSSDGKPMDLRDFASQSEKLSHSTVHSLVKYKKLPSTLDTLTKICDIVNVGFTKAPHETIQFYDAFSDVRDIIKPSKLDEHILDFICDSQNQRYLSYIYFYAKYGEDHEITKAYEKTLPNYKKGDL